MFPRTEKSSVKWITIRSQDQGRDLPEVSPRLIPLAHKAAGSMTENEPRAMRIRSCATRPRPAPTACRALSRTSRGTCRDSDCANHHILCRQDCFARWTSGRQRPSDLRGGGMSERGSIKKDLRLGRPWSGREVKPSLDRCTLPPSRLERAQELIAMARAARARVAGAQRPPIAV